MKPSVDRIFSTAAAAYGKNLIAIVPSGTGSDGAVDEADGTVRIQNAETAAIPGMARSRPGGIVNAVAELDFLGA